MLSRLNDHVFDDPRVRVVTADAFGWLREDAAATTYDVVVSDLPDPGITPSTKLYSEEFYGLVARRLRPGGRIGVHAGPLSTRPRTFWTVEATLRAAGLATRPYTAGGRLSGFQAGPDRSTGRGGSPGDWGFVLAARGRRPPALGVQAGTGWLRSLSTAALYDASRDAERVRIRGLPPSTLPHPRYS
jgi:spermidine synthase